MFNNILLQVKSSLIFLSSFVLYLLNQWFLFGVLVPHMMREEIFQSENFSTNL